MNALKPLDYQIQRSNKRRTVAITIVHQQVIVKAPVEVDDLFIHQFVTSKKSWIQRKLIQFKPDIPFNEYKQHGQVWYMGKRYTIVCHSNQKSIGIISEQLLLLKANKQDSQHIQQQYLKWLHHQAKRMMPDLVEHCLQRIDSNTALQVKSITCKRTKSKWGHCTSDQRLQFNWIILMAPAHILEYLICHEISHLIEKNHSKKFWLLVASIFEQIDAAETWLKKNGEVLMNA